MVSKIFLVVNLFRQLVNKSPHILEKAVLLRVSGDGEFGVNKR